MSGFQAFLSLLSLILLGNVFHYISPLSSTDFDSNSTDHYDGGSSNHSEENVEGIPNRPSPSSSSPPPPPPKRDNIKGGFFEWFASRTGKSESPKVWSELKPKPPTVAKRIHDPRFMDLLFPRRRLGFVIGRSEIGLSKNGTIPSPLVMMTGRRTEKNASRTHNDITSGFFDFFRVIVVSMKKSNLTTAAPPKSTDEFPRPFQWLPRPLWWSSIMTGGIRKRFESSSSVSTDFGPNSVTSSPFVDAQERTSLGQLDPEMTAMSKSMTTSTSRVHENATTTGPSTRKQRHVVPDFLNWFFHAPSIRDQRAVADEKRSDGVGSGTTTKERVDPTEAVTTRGHGLKRQYHNHHRGLQRLLNRSLNLALNPFSNDDVEFIGAAVKTFDDAKIPDDSSDLIVGKDDTANDDDDEDGGNKGGVLEMGRDIANKYHHHQSVKGSGRVEGHGVTTQGVTKSMTVVTRSQQPGSWSCFLAFLTKMSALLFVVMVSLCLLIAVTTNYHKKFKTHVFLTLNVKDSDLKQVL